MNTLNVVAASSLFCNTGSVATVNQRGNGNRLNEWEFWIAGIHGYNWATGQWDVLGWSPWHCRDSGDHPFVGGGGPGAWLIYPSGAANSYATWSWGVSSGAWYAVKNWRYSNSGGWGSDWAHNFGDTTWPQYCQAF